MDSLLGTLDTWDICLSIDGDIAVASEPYSVAQDIASYCKTILAEYIYDTTIGVNYPAILGKQPPLGYIKDQLIKAALQVPTVTSAVCYITYLGNRNIGGQIIGTSNGTQITVGF